MRKLMVGLVIALMVMGLVNVAAHAQNLREYTGYQIMNLATQPGAVAHVRVDYYGQNGGTPICTHTLPPISPKASYNVQQKTESCDGGVALPDGVYSAVLSSDQPIAAVVAQVESDPALGLQFEAPFSNYTGASAGSRTVVLPSVMHNWFGLDTLMRVQNVGDGPATMTITYTASNVTGQLAGQSNIAPMTQSIPRYAAVTIDQATLGNILAASGGTFRGRFFGSAIITSDQPLVAIVNETDPTLRAKYTYNGFGADDSGTELIVPAIYSRWFGTYTTLSVQNAGSSPVQVTITYKAGRFSQLVGGGDGTNQVKTVQFTLQPGEASNRNEKFSGQADLWDTFTRFGGNARITANGNIVAKVNQQQETPSGNRSNPAGSYNAMPVRVLTTRVAAPLIQADYYGFYTTLACANGSSTQDGSFTVEYTSDENSARPNVSGTFTHPIAAGGGIRMYEATRNHPEADINRDGSQWLDASRNIIRFNGAAYLNSNVPLMCVVNEQTDRIPYDNMVTYNTVNITGQ